MKTDEVEKIAEQVGLKIIKALKETKTNEFELASKPFKSEEEIQKEKYDQLVNRPNKTTQITKTLTGFPTGTFLDYMFLDHKDEVINGLPKWSVWCGWDARCRKEYSHGRNCDSSSQHGEERVVCYQ